MPHNAAAPIPAVAATLVALAQRLGVTLVVWPDRLEIRGADLPVRHLTPIVRAHEVDVRACIEQLSAWGEACTKARYTRVIYFDIEKAAWFCRPRDVALSAAMQDEYLAEDLGQLVLVATATLPRSEGARHAA